MSTGMNDEKQIIENIETVSYTGVNSLSDEELNIINQLKAEFNSKIKVNCTNCAYCLPCPNGVDIPICFSAYNDKSIFGGLRPLSMYVFATGDKSVAYKCNQCGICLENVLKK